MRNFLTAGERELRRGGFREAGGTSPDEPKRQEIWAVPITATDRSVLPMMRETSSSMLPEWRQMASKASGSIW